MNILGPENLFYMSLMAAYVRDLERTLAMLGPAVAGGWFCHATIADEPWLECVRDTPTFAALVAEAETRHQQAAAVFREAGGDRPLGTLPS